MLAETLKKRRGELHFTQQAVADHLHVTRQAISSWECGKSYPDIPTLVKLSDYYRLSLDQMLKEDGAYLEKIKAEKKELTLLKKQLKGSLLPFFVLVGLLILLQLTQNDPSQQLWSALYLFCRLGVIAYSCWIFWLIKTAKRLNKWLTVGFSLLFLALFLRLIEPLFAFSYIGLITWLLQIIAFLLIFISVKKSRK
ncbi:helix-turn-helix transcriptional regulator [Enterococcus asini]|uniref:helix-turn-helix domain-containing protein n=1 Tax=Enterococcus asini TaxID=57732 RepID=UPI00288D6EBE|nr:helix-turn-helix transcriptional regulator [Enterococcus asini]MDT2757267.1 helix-turn-helix transcriptional regulator [Enterococcus asini]